MDSYSISDLEKFSGIKAHTIRMWEQRYKALNPSRSEGNTRYYDGLQLRRLLNIVSLMNGDFKISELCAMTDEQLNVLLEKELSNNTSTDYAIEYLISQCIIAAKEFNEERFDKFFSNALLRFGIKETYLKIIYPSLVRLGIMWAKDSLPPAQEHFITNLIRQKLHTAIDALPPPTKPEKLWLLFLLEDELHETGLLLSQYLIRNAGHKVIYLGSNVPLVSVEAAVEELNPTELLFFMVRKSDSANDLKTIDRMKKVFSSLFVYMASSPARLITLKTSKKFIRLFSVEDLEKQINNHS
ncbi:MAG: MerR family transcriptional regulator [Bacteroidia bacterium]